MYKSILILAPRLEPESNSKNSEVVESLCAKINSIDTDVITNGAFLYPGLTKSSKVSPAFIKNFRGKPPMHLRRDMNVFNTFDQICLLVLCIFLLRQIGRKRKGKGTRTIS